MVASTDTKCYQLKIRDSTISSVSQTPYQDVLETHNQSRRHKDKETQHKRKAEKSAPPSRYPPGYPKHNEHVVKDQREADEQIQLE